MIDFSVNKLVQDLEEVFIKNFDSKEKVESMEQVFTDFLLLRKLYSKFQTNPQSLIRTGLQLLKKTSVSIIFSFSVPDLNLQSLLIDPQAFIVDFNDFIDSKNVTIDDIDVLQLTQFNFQPSLLTRGKYWDELLI